MVNCGVILVIVVLGFCEHPVPEAVKELDGMSAYNPNQGSTRSVVVSPVGDIRAILGPQGKSITVCEHGDVIAIIYGDPTTDPNNPMEIKIAYSTDGGASFITYGAFSPELKRIYPGLDGTPDFCTTPGGLFFTWQESPNGYATGDQKVMIEENLPSAPSFSTPTSLPNAPALFPWQTGIAVAPDNPAYVIAHGWSYLNGGDLGIYCWISQDYGYTWTDPILIHTVANGTNGCGGHLRMGAGGYVAMNFHDERMWGGSPVEYPYLVESTDGGYTWLTPTPLPLANLDPAVASFWWHDMDLEIINNEPWCVNTDTGADTLWLWYPSGGSPGAWTWNRVNFEIVGCCSTWRGDTLFQAMPAHHPCYPSIAYDEVSGWIQVTYWAYYYKDLYDAAHQNIIEAFYEGNHIGGCYSTDNGAVWRVSDILSTPNIGGPVNLASETAHRLVNIGGQVWAYSVWIDEANLNAMFDKALLNWPGIEESAINAIYRQNFKVTPSIASVVCNVSFDISEAGRAKISLFDASGRFTKTIYSGYADKGVNTIAVLTSDLANGTYFVILETTNSKQLAKIVVAR